MKKLLAAILIIGVLLSLGACRLAPGQSAQPTAPSTDPTDSPTETTVSDVLYTQEIWRADFPVQLQPGYDYTVTGTVGQAGTYDIVEEFTDEEGNLWGKLKSGEGWIDLTLLRTEEMVPPILTIGYASHQELDDPYICEADTSKHAIGIAIHTHEELTDVSLFPMTWDETYKAGEPVFRLEQWMPGKVLVAHLAFPGDLSAYGIRFTDSQGQTHGYTILESGRNGMVYLQEFIG